MRGLGFSIFQMPVGFRDQKLSHILRHFNYINCSESLQKACTMGMYDDLFPEFLMWLLVAAFSFWAMVQVYEAFFRFRTRTRADRAFVNALLGRSDFCLHVPPNRAHVATGRGMRIQIAPSDHQFSNLDGATLTEMHPSTATPSLSEEEIKSMPIHNYTANSSMTASSSASEASSSEASREDCDELNFLHGFEYQK